MKTENENWKWDLKMKFIKTKIDVEKNESKTKYQSKSNEWMFEFCFFQSTHWLLIDNQDFLITNDLKKSQMKIDDDHF